MVREFVLQPFRRQDAGDLSVSGHLARNGNRLSVAWRLAGTLDAVSIPEPSPRPGRRSHLWEDTCFELFLVPAGSNRYWEINVAPSGDWNVFAFDGYRAGMREEQGVGSLPFVLERTGNELSIALDADMGPIIAAGADWQAGVSAVIRRLAGGLSYWALRHRGPRPDFHRRDSFVLFLGNGGMP